MVSEEGDMKDRGRQAAVAQSRREFVLAGMASLGSISSGVT